MKNYAYLIGNGLNRAIDDNAWVDMLDELRKKYDVEATTTCTNFPLEFERIYLDTLKKATYQKPTNSRTQIRRSTLSATNR